MGWTGVCRVLRPHTPVVRWTRALAVVGLALIALLGVTACSGDNWPDNLGAPASSGSAASSGSLLPYPRGVLLGAGHANHLGGRVKLVCTDCHSPKPDSFDRPGATQCARCHDQKLAVHVKGGDVPDAGLAARECTTCHSFLPNDRAAREPWRCMDCHATAQGRAMAITVMGKVYCGTCHTPHGPTGVQVRPCTNCHNGDRAPKHGTRVDKAKPCLECHNPPHQSMSTSPATCLGCHETKPPLVPATAVFSWGHQCNFCHNGHVGGKAAAKPCRTCHTDQHTLAETKVPQHAVCRSCHSQHAVQTASTACATCHTIVHKKDPPEFQKGCLNCHHIHARGAPSVAVSSAPLGLPACSSSGCHTKAASDTAFHAGGINCKECHFPHGNAPAPPRPCKTCHQSQGVLVAANAGHTKTTCKGCHTTQHTPQIKPQCPTCHAREAQSVLKGMEVCTNCHEHHSGTIKVACATCHANKKGPHVNIKGGCLNCHRPHGPGGVATIPACVSCHVVSNAVGAPVPGGLHEASGHKVCATCHGGHSAPRSDRATCTNCHKDRVTHNTAAQFCSGCHIFGGGRR